MEEAKALDVAVFDATVLEADVFDDAACDASGRRREGASGGSGGQAVGAQGGAEKGEEKASVQSLGPARSLSRRRSCSPDRVLGEGRPQPRSASTDLVASGFFWPKSP